MTLSAAPVFSDLHLLTVLAQTRSFTQAARRLGISKASASMRIAELERARACRWCAEPRARWA